MSKTYDEPDRWNAVYICTTHDVNGNPRRGWAVQRNGCFVTFLDEGCGGKRDAAYRLVQLVAPSDIDIMDDAHQEYYKVAVGVLDEAMYVNVAPSEYRAFVRNGKSMDKHGEIR